MSSGIFDLRGAQAYSTVRRAHRWEKMPLGTVHRRPQQEAGEICGLGPEAREEGFESERFEGLFVNIKIGPEVLYVVMILESFHETDQACCCLAFK